MATSYPAVGSDGDVNDAQHIDVHAIGDGIVEDFHADSVSGASITLNNATNEVTLSDHRCRVAGYVGDSEGAVTLSVPAVGVTTIYSIGWCYDPALNVAEGGGGRSDLGPVRLFVEDGSLDTSGGKRYCVLYTIIRTAAQVLTASTRADHRRWVGSALTMPTYAEPTVLLPRGTQILETSTGSTYLRDVNDAGTALTWRNVSAPAAIPFPLASGLVSINSLNPAVMYKSPGNLVSLRGSVQRSSGANLGTGASVTLGTLPVGWRPGYNGRWSIFFAASTSTAYAGVSVAVNTAGLVTMPAGGPQSSVVYVHLEGIIFRAGA